jgi:hypothetical protein
MARYSAAASKTSAATANLWIGGLSTTSGKDARVWEIGVFLETAIAQQIQLFRQNAAGTTPTSVTPQAEDSSAAAAACTIQTAWSTPPTSAAVPLRRIGLPATVGAGIIWTFPGGLVVPTSSSLNLFQVVATATQYGFYFVYEE